MDYWQVLMIRLCILLLSEAGAEEVIANVLLPINRKKLETSLRQHQKLGGNDIMENLKIGDRFDMYESLPSDHKNVTFPVGTQRIAMKDAFIMYFFSWFPDGRPHKTIMMDREIKKIGTWVVKRLANNDPITII